MSADFLCWIPTLALLPGAPDFIHRTDALSSLPARPPTPAIVRFVDDLLKRYPDLSDKTDETAWADGPMIRDANGGFIHFSIRWDYYDKVVPFVTATARRDGLNCFDPQSATYYPGSGKPTIITKYAVPEPVTDEHAAIEKARRVCALEPNGTGQWHAKLEKNTWRVWFGASEGGCGSQSAEIERDGSTAVCETAVCRGK
jgi:hypothetical protein